MSYDHTRGRRQHLLAVLLDAPTPISTTDLYKSCPLEQPVWADEPSYPGYSNVYATLRQLERRGLISSLRMPGTRSVYWRAVLTAAEAATFDAMVAAFDVDAP